MRIAPLLATQIAAVTALHALGRIPWLRLPDDDLIRWATSTPPLDALAACARGVGLVVAWWLLLTTLAHLVALLTRVPAAIRATAVLAVPAVRRATTVAVLGSTLAGTPALAAPGPIDPPVPATAVARPEAGPGGPSVPIAPHVPAADQATAGPYEATAATHVVVAGESLWSIAVDHAGDSPVGRYWRALVAANAARLRSGDPDLIAVGELVVLPRAR